MAGFDLALARVRNEAAQLHVAVHIRVLEIKIFGPRRAVGDKNSRRVEGVGFGCKTAINSIGSGISGIVTRPIEEGRKKGVKGVATKELSLKGST